VLRIKVRNLDLLLGSSYLRRGALLAVLFCAATLAQGTSTGQSADNHAVTTFQSGVNLVLVPVIVRNKQGQAIGNLTQSDFQIFDRGKRQVIAGFSAIKRDNAASSSEPDASTPAVATGKGHASSPVAAPRAAAENPRHFVIYLFDDLNITFADMAAVRSAMSRHIRGLKNIDQAAIYTFSGRAAIDFTNDKDKLDGAVAKLRASLSDISANEAKECPNVDYFLADLNRNQNDQSAHKALVDHTMSCMHVDEFAALSIVEGATQRQLLYGPLASRMALRSLRLAIRRLADMPGERLIVLTSPGFFVQTPESISDREQLLKIAAKADVTISALMPAGFLQSRRCQRKRTT